MRALVIVDVQNDFVPGGALPVPGGDRVAPAINRLQEAGFDLVVATRDWHPSDHGSFARSHPGRRPGDVVELGGVQQLLWPVHCVAGTPGAAFVPGLDLARVTRVFDKGTERAMDSYSAFCDNGHQRSTGLGEYLRDHGVREVFIAGLATDYCVKATALDAADLGFETWLVEDACQGVERRPGDVARALDEVRRAGVGLLRLADVVGDAAGWHDPGAGAPGSPGVY